MSRPTDDRDDFAEDWFEDDEPAPEGFHDPEGETWLEPDDYEEEPHDRRTLIAAIAGAIVLVLIVVGLVRVLGGGDDELDALPATTVITEPVGTDDVTTDPVAPSITVPEDVALTRGDENDDVALLQEALIELGYDPGEPDGLFGAATEEAVQQFQADTGLEADGIAGPETLASINEALASGG